MAWNGRSIERGVGENMKRNASVRGLLLGHGGTVMPLVGFIIIALLALAAIAVDVGYILVTKQHQIS